MKIVSNYILIKPNWAESLKYRRRWQTNILSSLTGLEQRSAIFTWPRRSISYSVSALSYSQISNLKKVLFKDLHNQLGIPYWQDRTVLVNQASLGQKVLNVESALNRNFEVGGLGVLIASENSFEDGIIDSISSNQIVLHDNLENTWPVGTELYPVMIGKVAPTEEMNMLTSMYGNMTIGADEDYYAGITRAIGDAEAFPTYKNLSIFDVRPNWLNGVNFKLYHPYDYMAFLGKSYSMSHYDESVIGLKIPYSEYNRAALQKYLDFFDAQKGRWGNFWVPTWQQDLIITAPFSTSDNILSVQDIDFASYWLETAMGSYIIIFWPDWTYAIGKIIDATDTTIVLESMIGKNCSAGQVSRLLTCFLLCSRFDQDEIEVEYLGCEVGNINFSYRGLFGEDAEAQS